MFHAHRVRPGRRLQAFQIDKTSLDEQVRERQRIKELEKQRNDAFGNGSLAREEMQDSCLSRLIQTGR